MKHVEVLVMEQRLALQKHGTNLGVEASLLGPLMVGQGVGGIFAGLIAPRLMAKYGRVEVYAIGAAVLGVSLAPLASSSLVLLVVSQFIVGCTVTTVIISFVTERQIATPKHLQGRVAAASQVILNLPGVLATSGSAAVIVVIDYRFLILGSAVIILVTGVSALRLRLSLQRSGQ